MDIDIILECDASPAQVAEIAVEAEKLGVRAIWTSNYHQNYDCFMALMPAASVTSKIKLGIMAITPWELHPLKMANATHTLNQHSKGRAIVSISGGGGVLGALGWRINKDSAVWPLKDPLTLARYPERRVRGLRECIDILNLSRSGKMTYNYDGEIFQVTRPFQNSWDTSDDPFFIYGCCSGPMMIRAGAQYADGVFLSDYTVDMMPSAIENLEKGFAKREWPKDKFRLNNFWAWHIKDDAKASQLEGQRELIWRGAIAGKAAHDIRPHVGSDEEVQLIIDNWDNFFKAFWTRSGQIDNIPEELSNQLLDGMSSWGGPDKIDQEIARYQAFADAGLTELAIRLFDDPMDSLKLIGERVMPKFR